MTLLVRDEEDIIAENIAYHLSRGVDHVIVTDNASTDATRDVLLDFQRAGAVTLIDEPGDDFSQAVWVTRMARLAARMGADWVINSDADEIWWPREGDLKTVCAGFPRECGSVTVTRYNLLPVRASKRHPFDDMVFREVCSTNTQGLPLPGKAAHRAVPDVEVQQGNHGVSSPYLGPNIQTDAMSILHFPYRTYAQFERKIANGGAAYAKNARLPEWVGATWRALYRLWLAGGLQAWSEDLVHADDAGVSSLLASGAVVEDRRLAAYMRDLIGSGTSLAVIRS